MDEPSLRRRLQKALVVAEKLKRKELFEQEVNRELAKRNELLKKQLAASHEQLMSLSRSISRLDDQFETLFKGEGQNGGSASQVTGDLQHQVHYSSFMHIAFSSQNNVLSYVDVDFNERRVEQAERRSI
jgi:hypothetical protein